MPKSVAQRCEVPNPDIDISTLKDPIIFQNGKKAPNRFMKASMTEKLATFSVDYSMRGIPTTQLINLYEKWGHGGFGMILTGNVMTHPNNLEGAGNVIICEENYGAELKNGLRKVAEACKSQGSLACMQLANAGRQTPFGINKAPFSSTGTQLEFPAGTGFRFGVPIALTSEQIKSEVIDRFVFAAKVAHEVGFDGIELHGAHGYLLSEFLSPATNRRQDKYGGTQENRTRILIEIYDAIRQTIAKDSGFLIGVKINSVEFQNDGLSTDDAKVTAKMIEEAGFDFVEFSGGNYEIMKFHHEKESTRKREAYFVEFTDQLRSIFKNTRVYLTGGFRSVTGMVEAIEDGACDGIGLARPVAAEPDLPKKILSGTVKSAVNARLDPTNFVLGMIAAGTQMARAGWRNLQECESNVMADIIDLSDESVHQKYMSAVMTYIADVVNATDHGKVVLNVFEFNDYR